MALTDNRWLFDVHLEPLAGSRFQPTGFPDLGHATYRRPMGDGKWVDALLVESTQSVANHLEGTAWDRAENAPVELFSGLPYVRVEHVDDASYLTSSREESHRLASAFIKDSTLDGVDMKAVIRERLGLADDRPIAPRSIARAVFALDPFCLLHGVFFAESAKVWPGQPRIARAVSGFIEATDVERAESGGVKRDHVRHSIGDTGGSQEGYGSIPFARTEWTAQEIVASFAVDRAQIRSYGLGEDATKLLELTALWEIRSLLDGELRLRTACDLVPLDDEIVGRGGVELPTLDQLESDIEAHIGQCADLLPDGGGPIVVKWQAKSKGR